VLAAAASRAIAIGSLATRPVSCDAMKSFGSTTAAACTSARGTFWPIHFSRAAGWNAS
jgi:hypothetical protein